MFNVHISGISTTESNKNYSGCPFTTHARMLTKVLVNLGHNVYHYGNGGSETDGQDVHVTEEGFLESKFGASHRTQYHAPTKAEGWNRVVQDFNAFCAAEIRRRIEPGDFVIIPSDGTQRLIDLLSDIPDIRFLETCIGYNDPIAEYKRFESHTWYASWRARMQRSYEYYDFFKDKEESIVYDKNLMIQTGEARRVQDIIIPPMYDPADFALSTEEGEYYLFLGRVIASKGVMDAVKVTEAIGAKLIIAGAGDYIQEFKESPPSHVECVGMADFDKRDALINKCIAILGLTRYNEPGGNMVLEGFMKGKPAITSNTGCFTETNMPGISGYRGDYFEEWLQCTQLIRELDSQKIREYAMSRYSLQACTDKWNRYLTRIDNYEKSGRDEYFIRPSD